MHQLIQGVYSLLQPIRSLGWHWGRTAWTRLNLRQVEWNGGAWRRSHDGHDREIGRGICGLAIMIINRSRFRLIFVGIVTGVVVAITQHGALDDMVVCEPLHVRGS